MSRDERAELLRTIASDYVANLAGGDFDRIPYADEVELRAPLCPCGSDRPFVGKQSLLINSRKSLLSKNVEFSVGTGDSHEDIEHSRVVYKTRFNAPPHSGCSAFQGLPFGFLNE